MSTQTIPSRHGTDHTRPCRIYIVGEGWGESEERYSRNFAGPGGQVLRGLLAQAGIDEADCIFDNVFNFRVTRLESLFTRDRSTAITSLPPFKPGHFLKQEYAASIAGLMSRIAAAKPMLVLALGNAPLWAITHCTGIKKWRGSPLMSANGEHKVLASWHPAAVLRQWNLRPILFMDIVKAERESKSRLLTRPRRIIHIDPSLDDIEQFIEQYIEPAPLISCDIETKANTITEVGFAPSRDRCIVIPFWSRKARDGNYWPSAEAERHAWELVRHVCTTKRLIGQNFQYDMQYFYRKMGIPCPGFAGDTMLLHHSLQPELEKGLGFLGSIYTDEPSWKFMRTDHSTLKREDD